MSRIEVALCRIEVALCRIEVALCRIAAGARHVAVAACRFAFVPVLALAALAAGDGAWGGPQAYVAAGAAPAQGGDLWITREQRAQRLFDSGREAEAAQLFSDPRRRAYADSRIGRYADAARLLAPLHDPDSEYNRGNALARSGNLLGALAAYDAALEQAPHDHDIRHNRDLVAQVLLSRAQPQSGQGGNSQSDRHAQRNRGQSNRNGRQGSGEPSSPDARSGRSAGSQGGQSPSAGGSTPEQEAEQAKQDAELAAELRRRGQRPGQNPGAGRQSASGSTGSTRGNEQGGAARAGGAVTDDLAWPPPKSEQALALEQWLRRIPEDPGGLLRRKFLIEHMERQEGNEP